jgi:hypothetical protein
MAYVQVVSIGDNSLWLMFRWIVLGIIPYESFLVKSSSGLCSSGLYALPQQFIKYKFALAISIINPRIQHPGVKKRNISSIYFTTGSHSK